MTRIAGPRAGFTLIEVVVAVMVVAIAVTALFSVIASNMVSERRVDTTQEVSMLLATAQERLKPYVLANTLESEAAPVPDYAALPNKMQNGVCGADAKPLLQNVNHDLTCLLPNKDTTFSGAKAAFNLNKSNVTSFYYTVTYINNCGTSSLTCYKVNFTIDYDASK